MTAIDPKDELYRRILSYHVKPDNSISSAAFMTKTRKPEPECSVYLARLTSPAAVLRAGLSGQRLAGLLAESPMSLNLVVKLDERPDDPGHCLIVGLATKEQCSRLAEAAYLVPVPEQAPHESAT
jgi:hypothetical protein